MNDKVSVPVEPTEEMIRAGDLFFTNASFVSVSPAQIRKIYSEMLAARPAELRAMLDAEPSEAMINAGVLAYDTSISASIFGTIKEINKAMRAEQVKEIAAQQVNQSDSLTLTAVAATKQENVK